MAKLVGLSNGTVQRIKVEMAMERIKEEKAVSSVQLAEPA